MAKYGVQWISNTSTPTLTRKGDNIGMTAGTAFNSVAPWSGISRCNLWSTGAVTANYGDRCYTDTSVANMGNVMVKVPAFYYYVDLTKVADGTTPQVVFWISNTLGDVITNADATTHTIVSGDIHPAFLVDSAAKSYAYVGAYESYVNLSSVMVSMAGVTPTGSYDYGADIRPWTEANGTGWEMMTVQALSALKLLFIVEYASLNSSTALGYGIIGDTGLHNTGETAGSGNTSTGTTGNQTTAMSYRGVENLWGNMFEPVDGINIKANYAIWLQAQSRLRHYAFDTFDGTYYVNQSASISSASSNITNILTTPSAINGLFLPSAASGGSSSTYFCDTNSPNTGNVILFHSGYYAIGVGNGLFTIYQAASNLAAAYVGSRLQYLPTS